MIFGILALTQIRRTGEKGHGMAVAGLVLSAIWSVVFVGVIGYMVGTGAAERGGLVAASLADARSGLRVGDSIGELPDDEVLLHVPTPASWRQGDHEVTCLVHGAQPPGEAAGAA